METASATPTWQLSAFLRPTLPLDHSRLPDLDSGRYHSLWVPDHMVSLWPESIWTPEFTDLATVSHSPHRYLDGLTVAAAAAVQTEHARIATTVVDTVRRHPASLAQTALTIDHLSRGRFILGLGSGEMENVVPYGFDFSAPVSRFEESLQVIRLLWESDGPVDFDGRFYRLQQARLDTEPYEGRFPPVWVGASGPRMLEITGRFADGWWPVGQVTPEELAEKRSLVHQAAERAERDPSTITTACFFLCLIGEEAELAEIVESPLVKAYLLQVRGDTLRRAGFRHPLGDEWGGIQDLDPRVLTRERMVAFLDAVDPEAVLAVLPHGSPSRVAELAHEYLDVGVEVTAIVDYSGMAGVRFGAASADKVRAAEDEVRGAFGVEV